MVFFVIWLELVKNRYGVRNVRPFNHDFLEPPVEGTVLFNDFSELVSGRSSDALDFASCEGRLEHVCRIKAAGSATSSDNSMEFIDEEDDIRPCGHFVDDGLEPFLEVTAVFGSCNDGA